VNGATGRDSIRDLRRERRGAVAASIVAWPPDRVEDGDRVEVVALFRFLSVNDGDHRDVAVSVGGAAVDNSPLGGVLEYNDPGLAVVMDGEIEAAIEQEGVAVWPVQLDDRRATDDSPRITGDRDDVFETASSASRSKK